MDNMRYYAFLRNTPKEAKKEINAGRLRGFSDINPAWRMKALTELYGPCGIGWKYTITRQDIIWAGEEAKCFVNIDLFYRDEEGEWSDAIPGMGGSSFVAKEKNGLYVDDECYKKALSDAIGTAAKALGMSHDVYFSQDRTKYTASVAPAPEAEPTAVKCEECGADIASVVGLDGKLIEPARVATITKRKYGKCLCSECAKSQASA